MSFVLNVITILFNSYFIIKILYIYIQNVNSFLFTLLLLFGLLETQVIELTLEINMHINPQFLRYQRKIQYHLVPMFIQLNTLFTFIHKVNSSDTTGSFHRLVHAQTSWFAWPTLNDFTEFLVNMISFFMRNAYHLHMVSVVR